MKSKFRLIVWLLPMVLVSCTQSNPLYAPSTTIAPTPSNSHPLPTATQQNLSVPTQETLPFDRTDFEEERLAMVAESIIPYGIEDPDVIRAMQSVPRHMFVPENLVDMAYIDRPLPIGYGQTISQPAMVALMTQLLDLEAEDKVLEIGTGSGYQAAVLAEIGSLEVYSIEIVPELAVQAEKNLAAAGYENIQLKQDDGYYGWPEHAPFDAIIVTAAPDHLPTPLVEQLREGGILVIPIGPPGWYQTLWKFTKTDGNIVAENMGAVSFVPFTGEGVSSQEP